MTYRVWMKTVQQPGKWACVAAAPSQQEAYDVADEFILMLGVTTVVVLPAGEHPTDRHVRMPTEGGHQVMRRAGQRAEDAK